MSDLSVSVASIANRPVTLPQAYIGRVNVVGDCYCLGVVVDRRPPTYKNIPIYISVAGPATSVEALWAKLSQGKETAVVPEDRCQPSIYLEPNKGGLYTRYQKKIDWLGIDHLVLVHEDLAEPHYPATGEAKEVALTYVLAVSETQRQAKLAEHVRKTVKVAVFETWYEYLYTEGRGRGLVRDCDGHGLAAFSVRLDCAKWSDIITSGLAAKHIQFP